MEIRIGERRGSYWIVWKTYGTVNCWMLLIAEERSMCGKVPYSMVYYLNRAQSTVSANVEPDLIKQRKPDKLTLIILLYAII